MKYNYLFVDGNNGHRRAYHPFTSSTKITPDMAPNMLRKHEHDAVWNKMGTSLSSLLDFLDSKGIEVAFYKCPHCSTQVREIENPVLSEWEILYGIDGNY